MVGECISPKTHQIAHGLLSFTHYTQKAYLSDSVKAVSNNWLILEIMCLGGVRREKLYRFSLADSKCKKSVIHGGDWYRDLETKEYVF